jgi:hypothetical protein
MPQRNEQITESPSFFERTTGRTIARFAVGIFAYWNLAIVFGWGGWL